MSTVEEIEAAIRKLAGGDIFKLGAWFDEYRADLWDKQIEEDAKAGRLDKLAAEAKADYRAGRTRPLP